MKQTVAVLGEGAWGTAVSSVLAHNGHTVKLWCNDSCVAETILSSHINQRYMPDIKLSSLIIPTCSIQEVFENVDVVFVVSPVKYMRCVLTQAKPYFKTDQMLVSLSKGIEQKSLMLPSQIIEDVFDASVGSSVCLGPSFADEVIQEKFTGVILASHDQTQRTSIKKFLKNEYFRVYESSDVIGVQIGSALKNVIALGYGVLQGAGYGENAKAFLLTRALHDMVTCSKVLGGRQETIYGLSGIGDLVLTCTGGLSRNVMVGSYFGQGKSLETIIAEKDVTPEGVNTVQSINELAQKYDISLPVCQGIYEIVFQGKSVDQFLRDIS